MMGHSRSTSGNGEDNVGIPEHLRCKRTDGKQWRCSAMSMSDKTVCEKHYIQAKKRSANSALKASEKKTKRKPLGESDVYLESKNDDFEVPLVNSKVGDYSASVFGKKYKDKVPKNQALYSPEIPPSRSSLIYNPPEINDDPEQDIELFDDNCRSSCKTASLSSSRSKTQNSFDSSALEVMEHSDRSTESSDEAGGNACHHCRRKDRARVIWCLRCDRRGYCDGCISKWYSDIPSEEIHRVCPACRGTCNCKVCLRGDNLIKLSIREMAIQDKLQYLHCLLSSVLPVVKRVHYEQCSEQELEMSLQGSKKDIPRAILYANEQMFCNSCRIPIIDYHRHCGNCSYDLCLACCQDLREASTLGEKRELVDQVVERCQDGTTVTRQTRSSELKLNLSDRFPDWKTNSDGIIPCPPKEYGGCGCPSLTLRRIFKINWVAKLVTNVEEMVNGCKVGDVGSAQSTELCVSKLCQSAHREDSNDNFLYFPTSHDIKIEGVGCFHGHWVRGEPVVLKQACDTASASSWDPMVIWRGILENTNKKMNDENRTVKAIDCLDWSEVDIELGQLIKGYSEGRIHENGWPEMLKLKDWPSPTALEEFLLYQRPEFISKLPLLEYIHPKLGLLNVAARLPHYYIHNDLGPKIFINYGMYDELGRGDSVTNLHFSMHDMVFLLMHTSEVKLKGWQRTKIEKMQRDFKESDAKKLPGLALGKHAQQNECGAELNADKNEIMEDQETEISSDGEGKEFSPDHMIKTGGDVLVHAGAIWDVFRRQDVPKLVEYLRVHWEEFRKPYGLQNDSVTHPLYYQAVFLSSDHKRKLKEEFRIEPWTFKQYVGDAVFIPTGCPYQMRNLQSSVQLGLDFLSPESLGESVLLTEEIRCLPNDHEMKLQMLEVGKMSLYAASSAIKEVQKLVLDPNIGAEIGFEDPNLTAMVSANLEEIKRRQIACV